MKNAILISILSAVLVVGAASVYAAAPISGVYKSSDGDFDEGRETTSWVGGGFLNTDNKLHARSWNGAQLGIDWIFICPIVQNVNLEADLVFAGYGSRIYMITYFAGAFSLQGLNGQPWSTGDASYNGFLTNFTEIRTLIFENNVMVGSDSDYSFSGYFQNYPDLCLTGIANGVWLGNGVPPASYPYTVDVNCSPAANNTHFGDVRDLTFTIAGCTVGTEESTWGKVKSLYRD